MTTEEIQQTQAGERKATAAHHLQTLTSELEQLKKRKETAASDVGRLHDEIATAERAGAEPKTLTALRRDRTEAEQVSTDLDRVISNIEAELIPAKDELMLAKKACKAEGYNVIVEKQRALAEVIDEALHTIVETLKVKEGLAKQQDRIQGDIGCPQPHLSPSDMRARLRDGITERLDDVNQIKQIPPFSQLDWTCRHMHDRGHLE